MADADAKQQQRRIRLQRLLRTLFACCLVLVGLTLLGNIWYGTLNDVPALKIPLPTMPNPNARDYFIKACGQIVDDKKLGDLETAAGKGGKGGRLYTLAEKIALIRENDPAVRTLHQGFAFPYQEIPARSYTVMFPHFARFRGLARFLFVKGQVEAAQGNYDAAINSHMDAIQMGQMMPHGAPLIGMLVGIAVESIGGRETGGYIAHLNAAQARAAAKRMERIIALRMPWADVLQEEKWAQQASLLDIFRNPKWHETVTQITLPADDDDDDKRGRLEKLRDAARVYLVNKHEVLYNYTHYMDQLIANARLPYAAHPPDPPAPNDPVNGAISISGNMGRDKAVQMEAQNAQLCLSLALHAYRLEHGAYPLNLQALVPAYLSKLPDDPYALQGSYGYTRDRVGYTFSSGGTKVQQPKAQ